nr:reverse transcriptase domain, reverse transcriptase zinc-binding domain protein [Tanacetum cinerariifolium]
MILEYVENGPPDENGVTRPREYSELTRAEAIQDDCDVKATKIILQGEDSFDKMSITLFLANFLRGFLVDDEALEAIFEEIKEDFEVWSKVRVLCGMDSIPHRLIDVATFISPISKGKTVTSILSRLVVATTSYYIWLERNGRLFKKNTSISNQIVDVILSMVRLKLVTFKLKKISTRSRLLLNQWNISSLCIVHDGSLRNEKELIAHQETIFVMSQEKEAQKKFHKTREDKELEKVIALENKIKVLDDIVYKTGQSVQTMHMLNRNCKTSFVKPEFLKKSQRGNPRLYDIGCYSYNLALMLAPESVEMIRLTQESRSKLSDLIKHFHYKNLNTLYDLFVPQCEKSAE